VGCAYCGGQILSIRRHQDTDFCCPAHRLRYHEKLRSGMSRIVETESPPPGAGFVLRLTVAAPGARHAVFAGLMLDDPGPPRGPAQFPVCIAPVVGGSFFTSCRLAPQEASLSPWGGPPAGAVPIAGAVATRPSLPELRGGPFPARAKADLPAAAWQRPPGMAAAEEIPLPMRPAKPAAFTALPGILPVSAGLGVAGGPRPLAAPGACQAGGAGAIPIPAAPACWPAVAGGWIPDLPAPETELGGAPEAAGAMPAWPLPALPAPDRAPWPAPAAEPVPAAAVSVLPAFALAAAGRPELPARNAARPEMNAKPPETAPPAITPAPCRQPLTRLPAIATSQAAAPRMPLAPEFLEPRVAIHIARPASRRSPEPAVLRFKLRFGIAGPTARMLPAATNLPGQAAFAGCTIASAKPGAGQPALSFAAPLVPSTATILPEMPKRHDFSVSAAPRAAVPRISGFAGPRPAGRGVSRARPGEHTPIAYHCPAVLPGVPCRIAAPGIAISDKPVRLALFWRNAPAEPARLESFLPPGPACFMPETTPLPVLDSLEFPAEARPEQLRSGIFDPTEFARAAARKRRRSALVQNALAWAALFLAAVALWVNGAPIAVAKAVAGRHSFRESVAARASVEHRENFRSGMDAWSGSREGWRNSWSSHPDGYIRPGQFALFRPSMAHRDYRLEMLAQIERSSVAWAVRATDAQNYYAVKLTVVKPGPRPMISLVRYPVVGGKQGRKVETPLRATLQNDTPYRLAMQVNGRRFAASVEGQQVDAWTDDALPSGGVALFSDAGERARLYWIRVTGNDDLIGRFCALLASGGSPESAPERHAVVRFSVFPAMAFAPPR
jgi:hypothetical protein